jgi:formylglycine-generating enzyme required for sulfatase activity
MAGAILPPSLAALTDGLEREGLHGVEIAELVWLAGALRREGVSAAAARPPKQVLQEQAIGDGIASEEPKLGPEPAKALSTGQKISPQPAPPQPPTSKPSAELQPSRPSGGSAAASEAETLPILVEDPPLISHPMRLARALSPLNRLVESAGELELDEEATVEAIARAAVENQPWQPVLRPRLEPWLDLTLVFDHSPSMAIWARLEKDLQRFFSRYLRLRDVRQLQIRHGPQGPTLTTPGGRSLPPQVLLRADRRHLLLLVSDGCAPAWFDGSLADQLGLWGKTLPTALLQVFPEWMWERTALGGKQAFAATASGAMPPSQALDLRRLPLDGSSPVLAAERATTVPVLELDADLLAAWARLVVGAPGGIAVAYRFLAAAPAPALSRPAQALREGEMANGETAAADQERRLATFLANASPAAQRLLGLLTCVPLITLPIARLVQREFPQSGTPAQLAEVLLSGLLVLVDKPEGLDQADGSEDLAFSAADSLVYGFATPELRERLMALVNLRQARRVYDRVESAIAASLGCTVDAFRVLLCAPSLVNQEPQAALLANYARVSTQVLRRLGGEWAAFAEQVETAWEEAERLGRKAELEGTPKPPSETLLPCIEEEFSFSVARLQWIDWLPPLPGQRGNSPKVRGFLEPLRQSLDLQLVEIPAGSFLMGSPASEEGHQADEGPQHEVKLESFFLGRTPITQAQWREVAQWQEGPGERWGEWLNPTPSRFPDDKGGLSTGAANSYNLPVEQVSWRDAMEFCSRLSQRSGRTYTLPSESQWEYACRAGTTTPFSYGETLSAELANYDANATYGRGRKGKSRGQTTLVGSFAANAWGLHDMHGNVWEWCADHWHSSYALGLQEAPADGSPWLDATEADKARMEGERADERRRVLRGGSWYGRPVYCRSASRNHYPPAYALTYGLGFRVCCLP